ncbi:ribosome assembly RNA-binding protein YhbY [Collinsella sp. D33t1_170424_A12]|uniref:ribosome assembly RNA-binding protein YhbY n=1 Tax=Collinsella sp. D33t1_170424_A12 TaxID=2787135 RepID=UPI001899EE21|nr:ribosome assembly RNA-binding protein YhbY [Collinsella sp. D33t1_170424_A12]
MALSGKNIRQLRSLAHHLNPIIHIGKSDITDSLVKETEAALEARELIKCAVQDGSTLETREAANLLANSTGAEVVQVIGHRFALYRESSRDDIEKIVLS